MMKNSEVAKAFVFGVEGEAGNFSTSNGRAFSYETVIAQYINGIIYLNGTYYSNTTSKHLGLIKRALLSDQEVVVLKDIPMGVYDLIPYINKR